MDEMRKEGFNYSFNPAACDTCQGACCTGESGSIFATKLEFENIATFLDVSMDDLKQKYLKKVKNRYSIAEIRYNDSYDCIFYDRPSNGCKIYDVRPTQCRTFPFWDYFKNYPQELKDECPGVSFDDA
jgi:Fe-S-cluster containining protein